MRILVWIVGGIGIGIVAALLLGRFATLAGIILMLLGVGPMTALFIYSELAEPTRDMSAEGMLSTLILLMATPFGITVFLTGLLRRE
ncbi:MAG: hypothetical protein IIB38_03240 [Candidatus Hydrogenedentes bacterium]|nr:hypothetical protein [Candidatus Hydrogenedentota bacterium]